MEPMMGSCILTMVAACIPSSAKDPSGAAVEILATAKGDNSASAPN